MAISTRLLRMQVELFKPLITGCNIEQARFAQSKLGELMAGTHKSRVCYQTKIFRDFIGEWIVPKTPQGQGVVLYLHGGGYVGGDIDYARGFGTILAAKCRCRVFCAAYRLAPEYPYPAAVDDAQQAYQYLLSAGYTPSQILLCGESAGGGLIYALCARLKQNGEELPAGLIAISPWSDLTCSGSSYEVNAPNDPSMTRELLQFYADCYCAPQLRRQGEASPLFADVTGFPPSVIFVGGDEVMRDDAVLLHEKLRNQGCESSLTIRPGMWHAYILYGMKEAGPDMQRILEFVQQVTSPAAPEN